MNERSAPFLEAISKQGQIDQVLVMLLQYTTSSDCLIHHMKSEFSDDITHVCLCQDGTTSSQLARCKWVAKGLKLCPRVAWGDVDMARQCWLALAEVSQSLASGTNVAHAFCLVASIPGSSGYNISLLRTCKAIAVQCDVESRPLDKREPKSSSVPKLLAAV